MNIYFVRHGNPNYSTDTLTDHGKKQAESVANRLLKLNINDIYSSPYGRAKETALPFVEKSNIEMKILPWLHEIEHLADCGGGRMQHAVSMDPTFLRSPEIEALGEEKFKHPLFNGEDGIKRMVSEVYTGMDELLSKYGFIKEGNRFKVFRNDITDNNIVLFSHAGTFLLVLGYLLQMPDTWAWHSFFTYQTGVTWINLTDMNGYTVPRMYYMGDISHLTKDGLEIT